MHTKYKVQIIKKLVRSQVFHKVKPIEDNFFKTLYRCVSTTILDNIYEDVEERISNAINPEQLWLR